MIQVRSWFCMSTFINLLGEDLTINGYTFRAVQKLSKFERETQLLSTAEVGGVSIRIDLETYDSIELPPECSGVDYIVSREIQLAFPDRTDLLSPRNKSRDNGCNLVCESLVHISV